MSAQPSRLGAGVTTLVRRLLPRARRHGSERGASAVEFALVTPVLVVLVFGIIAFGIVLAQQLSISNAARQAARAGVVDVSSQNTCGAIQTAIRNAAQTVNLGAGAANNIFTSVVLHDASANTDTTVCARQKTDYSGGAATKEPCQGSSVGSYITVKAEYTTSLIIPLAPVGNSIGLSGKSVYQCEFS